MFNRQRMLTALIIAGILGVFCIIGVGYRLGYAGNELFLFATWYNRILMGLVIGLAGNINIVANKYNPYIRGLLLGLIVSLAHYFSSDLADIVGFIAGVLYGLIIDVFASYRKNNG